MSIYKSMMLIGNGTDNSYRMFLSVCKISTWEYLFGTDKCRKSVLDSMGNRVMSV